VVRIAAVSPSIERRYGPQEWHRLVLKARADMSRYLALDQIKAGDIILSPCWDFSSVSIRVASLSKYSHAILALSPTIWFEADAPGVHYRCPTSKVVWDSERRYFRLGYKIPRGYQYTLLRRTGIPHIETREGEHWFAKKLIDVTADHAFLDYARFAQFLPLVKFGLGELHLAKYLANILDQGKPSHYSGPFCSGLVASCYKRLDDYEGVDLNLFPVEPDRVSPRALGKNDKLTPMQPMQAVFDGHEKELPARFKCVEEHYRRLADADLLLLESDFAELAKQHTTESEDRGAMFGMIGRLVSTIAKGKRLGGEEVNFDHDKYTRTVMIHTDESVKGFKEFFGRLQARARNSVTKAYIASSRYAAIVQSFERCKDGCFDHYWRPPGHKSSESPCEKEDGVGCFVANQYVHRATDQLLEVFPDYKSNISYDLSGLDVDKLRKQSEEALKEAKAKHAEWLSRKEAYDRQVEEARELVAKWTSRS
jgi:hypothetical protein